MKSVKILVSAAAALTVVGCASTYTSISPTEQEGRYIVTEAIQVPFGIVSNVHSCEAQEDKSLKCTKID